MLDTAFGNAKQSVCKQQPLPQRMFGCAILYSISFTRQMDADTPLTPDEELPSKEWPRGRLFMGLSMTLSLIMGVPYVWQAEIGSSTWISGEGFLAATLLLAATSFWYASLEVSCLDALRFFALATGIGWLAEFSGVHTGFPFGFRYVYHPVLQPQLPGSVPLAIPLSWYVLLRLPVLLMRCWIVSNLRQALLKALTCGIFMAGCALLLDPLGQSSGLWQFARANDHIVQIYNAAGWSLVAFIATMFYFGSEMRATQRARALPIENLVLMMSLAFHALALAACAHRLGDLPPLLISTLLVLPCWVCWWRKRPCFIA
ncbi:MAG: carotenoid biosynthesis protein [Verrucomicrobiaceae bacterium]